MLLIYHHFILNTSKHLKMLFELMWEDIAGLDVLVFLIFGIFGILFMGLLLFFKVGSIMGMGPKEISKRIGMSRIKMSFSYHLSSFNQFY